MALEYNFENDNTRGKHGYAFCWTPRRMWLKYFDGKLSLRKIK